MQHFESTLALFIRYNTTRMMKRAKVLSKCCIKICSYRHCQQLSRMLSSSLVQHSPYCGFFSICCQRSKGQISKGPLYSNNSHFKFYLCSILECLHLVLDLGFPLSLSRVWQELGMGQQNSFMRESRCNQRYPSLNN